MKAPVALDRDFLAGQPPAAGYAFRYEFTLAGGQASFTTAALALGKHFILAVYLGDGTFTPSISPLLVQRVQAWSTGADPASLTPA